MQTRRFVRFVFSYVLVGIVVAVGILWLFPDALGPGQNQSERVVEFREAPATPSHHEPRPAPASYAVAVEAAAPAVVNVFTSKRITRPDHPFYQNPMFRHEREEPQPRRPDRGPRETNLGSGVIISDEGFVLTNNHVIDGAHEIQVGLNDGRSTTARVIGTDPETDLAVLKIEMGDLPIITLGRSEELRVGDVVLAIGNPFAVGQTVTQGIVSATGRSQLGLSTFENFIQTDAAINPGNSGGALVNADGELVGINTAIFSRTGGSHGIGFAIPAGLAQGVMSSIIENGRVIRGWAGVEVQSLTRPLAESFALDDTRGVIVAGVMRDGPAAEAGLSPGDLIFEINGTRVQDAQDLLRLVTEKRPGETIDVSGLTDGEPGEWRITVKERPRMESLRR